MARVEVDIQSIRNAADEISRYIEIHKNGMINIDHTFNSVNTEMIGEEFDLMFKKWNEGKNGDSNSSKMLKMLESYVQYLRSCVENYEVAKDNASIRATRI